MIFAYSDSRKWGCTEIGHAERLTAKDAKGAKVPEGKAKRETRSMVRMTPMPLARCLNPPVKRRQVGHPQVHLPFHVRQTSFNALKMAPVGRKSRAAAMKPRVGQ